MSIAVTDQSQAHVHRLFEQLPEKQSREEYNFEHFRTKHVLMDAEGTLHVRGIRPGDWAPDFELFSPDGAKVRLSALRGRPVLLHFGSPT